MIPMSSQTLASDQVLNSWKEIAGYLDRGVRTVQRWESELGLPVRRPRGRSRSAVIAMRSELDEWLKLCPLAAREVLELQTMTETANTDMLNEHTAPARLSDLVLRSRLLRHEIDRSRADWESALHRLLHSIQKIAQSDTDSSAVEDRVA